jgi:hypothetical protein
MSRPKPHILLARIDPKTYKAEQVLKSEAIYAVFLDGQPVNLRSVVQTLNPRDSVKYRKCSFSNAGHAHNLAARLNTLFQTDRFAVYKLTTGTPVVEGK